MADCRPPLAPSLLGFLGLVLGAAAAAAGWTSCLVEEGATCQGLQVGPPPASADSVLLQARAKTSRLYISTVDEDAPPKVTSGDQIFLTAHSGNRITVQQDGRVHAQWNHKGEWQKLTIEKADGGDGAIMNSTVVFLVGWTGKTITVQGESVHAQWNHRGAWQRFIVEKEDGTGAVRAGDTIFLKSWTGKHVDADGPLPAGGVQARWTDHGAWQRLVITLASQPATTTTSTPPPPPSGARDRRQDAQFLMQATFGPTRASVAALASTSYEGWIRQQIALPPGLHRVYYRERVNHKVEDEDEVLQWPRCKAGSRWLGLALTVEDVGKVIKVQNNQIIVDGVFRSDIDPTQAGNQLRTPTINNCTNVRSGKGKDYCDWTNLGYWACTNAHFRAAGHCQQRCWNEGHAYPGNDCTFDWAGMDFEGKICSVENTVGGFVQLSESTKECRRGRTLFLGMRNPAFWLANAGPDSHTDLEFQAVQPALLLLHEEPLSCNLGDFIQSDTEAPGRFYRFDPKVHLLENTPKMPTSLHAKGSCPLAPKSFLNEEHCQVAPGCASIAMEQARFMLNKTTLQTMHDVAGKYVFAVSGLRTTTSPCGTQSRWRKLLCNSNNNCSPSFLASTDAEAITNALEEGSGWLRDIDVSCQSVPAHAVVQVEDEFFQHVHLQEFNVYDFTEWVDRHPGGKHKIQQWTKRDFVLVFPQHHPMARWESGLASDFVHTGFLGRFQDEVNFQSLPQSLQTEALAEAFGAAGVAGSLVTACGSPGETANDPVQSDITKLDQRDIKSTVWLMSALYGEDQLRQRLAWALSQIIVAAVPGYGNGEYTEMWLNFYDIFVRNALGNYRDILREVTYNTIMGEYLSFKRNRAYDSGSRYPDENYAREVMQLFSIGLWKLNPDGSRMEQNGEPIPTYTNEHIMNFARVFTGFDEQPVRDNIELADEDNLVDPMRMRADWHDKYPKPDLDGNFLGDGYPLCSDALPRAFLSQGASYTFLGQASGGLDEKDVVVASQDSDLYVALCGNPSVNCDFRLRVDLGKTLACRGEECRMDTLRVVKVSSGYYRYEPQPCVQLYFFNGQQTSPGGSSRRRRKCADPGVPLAGIACCGANATTEHACDHKWQRVRHAEAEAHCARTGMTICKLSASGACVDRWLPVWMGTNCSVAVRVDPDGKVRSMLTSQSQRNPFSVQWDGGFPKQTSAGACPGGCSAEGDACVCAAHVETQRVFNHVPDRAQLKASLRIGAFRPTIACTSNCDSAGGVRVFSVSGAVDERTVFECDGRFFANKRSMVRLGAYSFRNPPNFMQPDFPSERDALAEVESLLDHLFHHQNTPVFIAYRLIQRLVTSNPSPAYVQAVGEAFRTGAYSGTTFSGVYGDLAATAAAILLEPEARSLSAESPSQGALREPMVKIAHFLRAMEYSVQDAKYLVLRDLSDNIGQFPYMQPSVFNFYLPDYKPDRFPRGLVAPEFEIFTPPAALSFLDGMLSMIRRGVGRCGDGFGKHHDCGAGHFGFGDLGSANATLDELDVLLTGGRLTSRELVQSSYSQASEGEELLAAQEAIVMSPEFNTLGAPHSRGQRAPEPEQPVRSPRSYKAVVMLFLGGGADTFNMLVPQNCPLYDEYVAVRERVALTPQELHKIKSAGQVCEEWGVHTSLSFVYELYEQKKAAFISNVGGLVEPLTRASLRDGSGRRCTGLFAHNHQQRGAQTLKCQVGDTSPKGAGGRIGDALATGSHQYQTTSFSVTGGSATWPTGFDTPHEILGRGGLKTFKHLQRARAVVDNITSVRHGNLFAEEYTQTLGHAVLSHDRMHEAMDNATLQTGYPAKSRLAQQFKQVAKLIASRNARSAERDIFWVSLGGWDTHNAVSRRLASQFAAVDSALREFVSELQAQDVFDQVTIVTHSEFGRTLTGNANAGTDHGWAGNHIVLGGDVRGGRVFNEYPRTLQSGNDYDAGRGRLIPKFPWESMMVPVAEWMGLDQGQRASVFPNLMNFNASQHIIGRSSLFQS